MKKIPTIFLRDMSKQPALVTRDWHADCGWVLNGEGVATRKYDGTCCMVRSGRLYKRRELRRGDALPTDFESIGADETTGKTVGWVPVGDGPEDKWHLAAFNGEADGTYELVGPKIQGNKDKIEKLALLPHGAIQYEVVPRDFDGLKGWLATHDIEGIVWHHPDGRMAKIKRRDFGLKW